MEYGQTVSCDARDLELRGGRRYIHTWVPNSETPWATMTVVHGLGAHGGRFSGMGTSLASMGIAVVAIDLVGHGRSPGRRGCIDSYEQLLDEVEAGIDHSKELFGNSPQFLYGQSMGGNLVLNLALRRPNVCQKLRGIIAGSPMLRPAKMPKESFMDAGRWLAKRVPNFRLIASVEASKLSQDRRAQDAFLRDRHVHKAISLRLAAGLIDSGIWALEHASELMTQTLVMHGSDDSLVCPLASQQFAESAPGVARFKLWAGCRHELHEDLQRERMFAYLSDWMKRQCVVSMSFPMAS